MGKGAWTGTGAADREGTARKQKGGGTGMAGKTKTIHSERFETLKARYGRGGCTKGQLGRFVGYGVLTPAEYKEITGEDYSG